MKEYIGYKVVTQSLRSAIVDNSSSHDFTRPDLAVQYSTENWVSPTNKHMPLMVFDNLEAALEFRADNRGRREYLHIYKCIYIKSMKKWGYCIDRLDEILNIIKNKQEFLSKLSPLPSGTQLADKVLLLERVG